MASRFEREFGAGLPNLSVKIHEGSCYYRPSELLWLYLALHCKLCIYPRVAQFACAVATSIATNTFEGIARPLGDVPTVFILRRNVNLDAARAQTLKCQIRQRLHRFGSIALSFKALADPIAELEPGYFPVYVVQSGHPDEGGSAFEKNVKPQRLAHEKLDVALPGDEFFFLNGDQGVGPRNPEPQMFGGLDDRRMRRRAIAGVRRAEKDPFGLEFIR